MIRAIFWKEWREHRWKYGAFWLVLNFPILLLTVTIALSAVMRTPFTDLSNATVLKYIPLALFGEASLVAWVCLFVTGFLAVATFAPEIEDRSLFFLYEQPLSRLRYAWIKFLNGAFHVALAATCAVFLAPAVVYGLMLLSGKVTLAGSAGAFGAVMAAAARGAVWCSLISLLGFTGSALLSALASRWWLATAGSVLWILLLNVASGNFFEIYGPSTGEPLNVGATIGAQWLTVSRPMPQEVAAFALFRVWPLLTAALLATALSAGTALVYTRKELK